MYTNIQSSYDLFVYAKGKIPFSKGVFPSSLDWFFHRIITYVHPGCRHLSSINGNVFRVLNFSFDFLYYEISYGANSKITLNGTLHGAKAFNCWQTIQTSRNLFLRVSSFYFPWDINNYALPLKTRIILLLLKIFLPGVKVYQTPLENM